MVNNAQLEASKNIIMEAFDVELIRSPEKTKISAFFVAFLLDNNFFALLNPRIYTQLAIDIFTDIDVREFVLNLTDRAAVRHSIEELSIDELNKTITEGFANNHTDLKTAKSLVPEKIKMSTVLNVTEVEQVLASNFWLTCLIVISLFVSEVSILSGTFTAKDR